MNSATAFQSAAKAILGVLAPELARVVSISIRFSDFSTASTDGSVVIRMPHQFMGHPIPENARIALGLLAHELGHWVQPLEDITPVEKQERIPGWVSNILLDIHGESFIEALFPAMRWPLVVTRRAVYDAKLQEFEDAFRDVQVKAQEEGWTDELKAEAVNAGMLIARFGNPQRPYNPQMVSKRYVPSDVYNAIVWGKKFQAETTSPNRLPKLLKRYIRKFPFLRAVAEAPGLSSTHPTPGSNEDNTDQGIPWPVTDENGPVGKAIRRSATKNLGNILPSKTTTSEWIELFGKVPQQTHPKAHRLAQQLALHFKTPSGGITVAAPGRLNRLEMARGAPIPFDMTLKGKASPAPQVALILDASGSMFNSANPDESSIGASLIAAQALTLALLEIGADVKTAFFDQVAQYRNDETLAFVTYDWVRGRFGGGTSFRFLQQAWREWEDRLFIVLTDGSGTSPDLVFPRDRERTVAVYIGWRGQFSVPWAHKSVIIAPDDLKRLAGLFASLLPRRFTQY